VAQPWLDPSPYEDLPAYLIEPPPPRIGTLQRVRAGLARVQAQPAGATRPQQASPMVLGGHQPKPSPIFTRMIPLHPARLRRALDAWWESRSASGEVVRVHRRLQLGRPRYDGSEGWAMRGRVRGLTSPHWVAIRLELWPLHEHFVRMTMTPQGRVLVSRRYFRVGHSALDRFSSDLIELSRSEEPTGS
jgi:hypothetical protein